MERKDQPVSFCERCIKRFSVQVFFFPSFPFVHPRLSFWQKTTVWVVPRLQQTECLYPSGQLVSLLITEHYRPRTHLKSNESSIPEVKQVRREPRTYCRTSNQIQKVLFCVLATFSVTVTKWMCVYLWLFMNTVYNVQHDFYFSVFEMYFLHFPGTKIVTNRFNLAP